MLTAVFKMSAFNNVMRTYHGQQISASVDTWMTVAISRLKASKKTKLLTSVVTVAGLQNSVGGGGILT